MDFQAIFDNFRSAVADHYFDMRGRVGRSQYWYFIAAYVAFSILAAILQSVVFLPLWAIYNLAMLLPVAGMGARRLQDTGHDGKLIWVFIAVGFVFQLLAVLAVLSAMSFAFMGVFAFLFFGPLLLLFGLIKLAFVVVTLVLIYFWCQPGDAGDNAYGPPPQAFDPSIRVPSSP
ncbi:MAG TPA: DUF805 domain-containing protein [Rhizomicrobium sp.]|nr:DUF805 domain-containing protein [Rhizomicrobium sp.]